MKIESNARAHSTSIPAEDATLTPLNLTPPRKKRRTPTERQIETILTMGDDEIADTALLAMHALNRRAKEIRDRKNAYRRATFARSLQRDIESIYSLKDDFLAALVRAGRARVETFEVERPDGFACDLCERTWYGSSECFGCGYDGEEQSANERWYVIDCGHGIRFHQPDVPSDIAAQAIETTPHNPSQLAREIPDVGLTIKAQKACVLLAVERLATTLPGASGCGTTEATSTGSAAAE